MIKIRRKVHAFPIGSNNELHFPSIVSRGIVVGMPGPPSSAGVLSDQRDLSRSLGGRSEEGAAFNWPCVAAAVPLIWRVADRGKRYLPPAQQSVHRGSAYSCWQSNAAQCWKEPYRRMLHRSLIPELHWERIGTKIAIDC